MTCCRRSCSRSVPPVARLPHGFLAKMTCQTAVSQRTRKCCLLLSFFGSGHCAIGLKFHQGFPAADCPDREYTGAEGCGGRGPVLEKDDERRGPEQELGLCMGSGEGPCAYWGESQFITEKSNPLPTACDHATTAVHAEDLVLRGNSEIAALTRRVPQAEDGSDEYGGLKPFSEPESRIVRLLAENIRPQVSPSPPHAVRARRCRCALPSPCIIPPEARQQLSPWAGLSQIPSAMHLMQGAWPVVRYIANKHIAKAAHSACICQALWREHNIQFLR